MQTSRRRAEGSEVRVGIVGCGAIVETIHARALECLASLQSVRVVADYDPDPAWRALIAARAAASFAPPKLKRGLRGRLDMLDDIRFAIQQARGRRHANPWRLAAAANPNVPLTVALLHQCRHKFSYAKAQSRMGYEPLLSVDEGLERTFAWLNFVGYPIVGDRLSG
jgi:hypothetical protein